MGKTRAGVGRADGRGVAVDFVAVGDEVVGAGWSLELGVATAGVKGLAIHFPGLEGTSREILTKEDVETIVDGLEAGVAHEDDGVEAVEDHADLVDGVPAVMAACEILVR